MTQPIKARLDLTRPQILAFRRHAGALDARLPSGPDSLRRAAWAGLQDSMPRAAYKTPSPPRPSHCRFPVPTVGSPSAGTNKAGLGM